jgi:hypothetical protein
MNRHGDDRWPLALHLLRHIVGMTFPMIRHSGTVSAAVVMRARQLRGYGPVAYASAATTRLRSSESRSPRQRVDHVADRSEESVESVDVAEGNTKGDPSDLARQTEVDRDAQDGVAAPGRSAGSAHDALASGRAWALGRVSK